MDHDLECGICFKSYNGGRRCPRELTCKHTFCESCLATISRPQRLTRAQRERGAAVPDRRITCPLCRHVTHLSWGVENIRDQLRANECVLERLQAEGVLGDEPEEAEDNSRRGRLRRAWKKVLRKVTVAESEDAELDKEVLQVMILASRNFLL